MEHFPAHKWGGPVRTWKTILDLFLFVFVFCFLFLTEYNNNDFFQLGDCKCHFEVDFLFLFQKVRVMFPPIPCSVIVFPVPPEEV